MRQYGPPVKSLWTRSLHKRVDENSTCVKSAEVICHHGRYEIIFSNELWFHRFEVKFKISLKYFVSKHGKKSSQVEVWNICCDSKVSRKVGVSNSDWLESRIIIVKRSRGPHWKSERNPLWIFSNELFLKNIEENVLIFVKNLNFVEVRRPHRNFFSQAACGPRAACLRSLP